MNLVADLYGKPMPEKWRRFMVLVSGACAMGISSCISEIRD